MRIATLLTLVVMVAALFVTAGCGNVYLKGDALTAAETSTLDACNAANRATADPNTPAWERAYLVENCRQWRDFVRSAHKDPNWGPRIAGE